DHAEHLARECVPGLRFRSPLKCDCFSGFTTRGSAMRGLSPRFSAHYAVWAGALGATFASACADPVATGGSKSADHDAAVSWSARSSLVANPANWRNLWG